MDLTVVFNASKNENTLQVIDATIPDTYFSLLELKEEAYNPTKSGKYTNRYDFTMEGIGYALAFTSLELSLSNTHNKFCIETFRNSANENFTVSIKPETNFYYIEATNGVHAFIAALQVLFHLTPKTELCNIFKPSWDGSILNSVCYYITESLQSHSSAITFSTSKKPHV